MNEHHQRVKDEKEELDVKLSKLSLFIFGEHWGKVSPTEQDLLLKQQNAMLEYSNILGRRVEFHTWLDAYVEENKCPKKC